MLKLKIGQRLVLLFLFVSLLPLGLVNFYWYRSAQQSLQAGAVSRQSLLTSNAVERVNQYLTDKVNALILHSQVGGVQILDPKTAPSDLTNLLKQDSDIKSVSLVDAKGIQKIVVDSAGTEYTNQDVSKSDAFRAATFLAGKEYISPVTYNSNKVPMVTIAVPLVSFEKSQQLSALSTDEAGKVRSQADIKGLLIADVDLSNLWSNVLKQREDSKSYSYVVDSQGVLIAYPESDFLASHRDLSKVTAVDEFLANPSSSDDPKVTMSEKNEKVLSAYAQIPRTGWGVIAEEPTNSIFAAANHVRQTGTYIFIVVGLTVILMSTFFSRRLTKPIHRLVATALSISEGRLDTRVDEYKFSKDELGALAGAFNIMANNLEAFIQKATAESTKVSVILNNAQEGIVAIDGNGVIIVANIAAAVLVGDLPKNILNKPFEEFFHFRRDNELFSPTLHEPGIYKDVTMTNLNKRVHFIDLLVNPMTDDPSGVKTIFTILDKTEERELENMRVDFVSMAAHELRTPLTAIRGYLDLIIRDKDLKLPKETQEYVKNIEASSTQLVGLINNLLNVSKIERSALTLNFNKVDWSEGVQRSIENHQFTAKAKDITLEYEGPKTGVFVLADDVSIEEVIDNLITNAIEYTQEGGHVKIRLNEDSHNVITSVTDDGIGISPNAIDKLFTKFYRAHVNGLSSGSGGTGLGLYISKSIVELHEGKIEVQSQLGKGTTFTVTLPAFDNERYSEIIKTRPTNIKKKHGWITKNTPRRG